MRKTLRDLKDAQENTGISWVHAKGRKSDIAFSELSEEELEAWLDEQVGLLDDRIGNEITKAQKQTPEAFARVLFNRLGTQGMKRLYWLTDKHMPWFDEAEEDEDADY